MSLAKCVALGHLGVAPGSHPMPIKFIKRENINRDILYTQAKLAIACFKCMKRMKTNLITFRTTLSIPSSSPLSYIPPTNPVQSIFLSMLYESLAIACLNTWNVWKLISIITFLSNKPCPIPCSLHLCPPNKQALSPFPNPLYPLLTCPSFSHWCHDCNRHWTPTLLFTNTDCLISLNSAVNTARITSMLSWILLKWHKHWNAGYPNCTNMT